MKICDICVHEPGEQLPWGTRSNDPRESYPNGQFDLCRVCTEVLRKQGLRQLFLQRFNQNSFLDKPSD